MAIKLVRVDSYRYSDKTIKIDFVKGKVVANLNESIEKFCLATGNFVEVETENEELSEETLRVNKTYALRESGHIDAEGKLRKTPKKPKDDYDVLKHEVDETDDEIPEDERGGSILDEDTTPKETVKRTSNKKKSKKVVKKIVKKVKKKKA